MARDVSFDAPPPGLTRRGQERGCLVVARSPDADKIKHLKGRLADQDQQIAELRQMVEALAAAKRGKKSGS